MPGDDAAAEAAAGLEERRERTSPWADDAFAAARATVEMLGFDRASPALLRCVRELAERTDKLLNESKPFSTHIEDARLALEVSVIQALAERLIGLLRSRDPLSQRVHLGAAGVAGFGLLGLISGMSRRIGRVFAAGHKPQDA